MACPTLENEGSSHKLAVPPPLPPPDSASRHLGALQADSLTFSSEVQCLQRRLAEVRARRNIDAALAPVGPVAESKASHHCGGCPQIASTQPQVHLLSHSLEAQGTVSSSLTSNVLPPLPPWPPPAHLREQGGGHADVADSCLAAGARRLGLPDGSNVASPSVVDNSKTISRADIAELKTENNRLTEQLVEASLESVQNFESFSQDRNLLLQFSQELRQEMQCEAQDRARCDALLTATEEELEQLAAENLHMAETIMQSRATECPASSLSQSSVDTLWTIHTREMRRLQQELDHRTQECEQLRWCMEQQTEQANTTILEMAKRNLDLEDQLKDAIRRLDLHGKSHGGFPGHSPEAGPQFSSSDRPSDPKFGLGQEHQSLVSSMGSLHMPPSTDDGHCQSKAEAKLPAKSWLSPPSKHLGVDGRYTGRKVAHATPTQKPPCSKRSDQLQRSLDLMSAQMRALQEEAISAVQ